MFGDVEDEFMKVNDAGRMIETWWNKISDTFNNIELDEFIIMPNHLHGIIFIVGVAPCVCPKDNSLNLHNKGEHTGSPLQGDVSLSRIMQWFKTMKTNGYIRNVKQNDWVPFYKRLWQWNYYDRIVRDDDELHLIRKYIMYNSLRWELDRNHPKNRKKYDRSDHFPL